MLRRNFLQTSSLSSSSKSLFLVKNNNINALVPTSSVCVISSSSSSSASRTNSANNNRKANTTHFSFGGKQKPIEKKREKKDFRDLFEFEGTVAKDSTLEEGRFAFWRLFWAKPIDHLDDTELDQKKQYEKQFTMRGYYSKLLSEGEAVMAKKSKDDSRWNYFRENLGGLFTVQMVLEVGITLGAFILLEQEVLSGKRIHDGWNRNVPAMLSADFASAESAATEPWTVPLVGITLSPVQQNHLHTAHALGTYSIPLQLACTWMMYPMLSRRWNASPTIVRIRQVTQRAMEEAEREKKRPKF